jgi:hypothetical protein
MSKKLLSLTVRGSEKVWSFEFYGDPKYLEDWREDGLEVNQIVNTVPLWVADLKLVRHWCFLQDIFNFKWPFESKGNPNDRTE